MKYFSDLGLTTKSDPQSENGGLFLAHYCVLKTLLNERSLDDAYDVYISKMSHAKVDFGLYKRSWYHNKRTVSQDEITGFMVASYLLNTGHVYCIWSYLARHWGNYPATGTNKFYNPGSYYAWASLAQSKIAPILAPLYMINLLISSNKSKNNTSSKLIYFSELFTIKDLSYFNKLLHKYFTWRMKKMYGERWINELFSIYFHDEDSDFPLLVLAGRT